MDEMAAGSGPVAAVGGVGRRVPVDEILCGDALRLLPELPPNSVDLLLTDPPYGDATGYGRPKRTIVGDEHPLVGLAAVAACYRLLKRNRSAYVFCGVAHLAFVQDFFARYTRFRLRGVLVWDKLYLGMGQPFRRRFECILVLEKGAPRYRDRGLPDLLAVRRPQARVHPHEKPVELLKRLILTSTDPSGLVLDPFAGSGAGCVAARLAGRHFLGIELEDEYVELARRRVTKAAHE